MIKKLYFYLGFKLGFLVKNGVYVYEGQDSTGMAIHKRVGHQYCCSENFTKE